VVGSRDGLVTDAVDAFEPGWPGECGDRLALALFVVPVVQTLAADEVRRPDDGPLLTLFQSYQPQMAFLIRSSHQWSRDLPHAASVAEVLVGFD